MQSLFGEKHFFADEDQTETVKYIPLQTNWFIAGNIGLDEPVL
jgi:hypothetical protein